jgi:hypothetical protein
MKRTVAECPGQRHGSAKVAGRRVKGSAERYLAPTRALKSALISISAGLGDLSLAAEPAGHPNDSRAARAAAEAPAVPRDGVRPGALVLAQAEAVGL